MFWHLWNTQRLFFGLLMRCGVHGSTRFLILLFIFLKYVFFCVCSWCDLLCTQCFFSIDIFEINSDIFGGVSALWVCWHFMRVPSFRFWFSCFWNMLFFVFILDAIFCGTNFFIFQGIVWLVKSSWCVQCCSIPQFYWVSDRRRSGFALWWFFFRKKVVVTNWLFPLASGPGY